MPLGPNLDEQAAHSPIESAAIPGLPRLARLARKELRETLRDRRVVLTLILMPALVYPLLSVAFQRVLFSSGGAAEQTTYSVGVSPGDFAPIAERLLRDGARRLRQQADLPAEEGDAAVEKLPSAIRQPSLHRRALEADILKLRLFEVDDLDRSVAELALDAGLRVRADTSVGRLPNGDWPLHIEIVYRPNSTTSQNVRRSLERRLQAVDQAYFQNRLQAIDKNAASPAVVESFPVEESGGAHFSLATLVPLILILMTGTGAVYPAIDLTAGERERGTLETLIAAPIPRLGILIAKYIAVLTVALLTAVVNLTAMVITFYATGVGTALLGDSGLSLRVVGQILALIVVFAAFFSGVLLMLTSFARSFKEAQAYLIPLVLAALAPGVMTLLPGFESNIVFAVLPLINLVLLARDLLEGGSSPLLTLATLVSTVLYTLLALSVAAKVFGTDAILYGSEGEWSDIWQRPAVRRPAPTTAMALLLLVVLFPIFTIVSSLLGQLPADDVKFKLILSAAISIAIFIGLPWGFARWQRIDGKSGFQLRPARFTVFLGAAILGGSLWVFAYELTVWLLPVSIERLAELTRDVLPQFRSVPLSVKLVCVALVPAVTEEFFFRGYLLNGLRSTLRSREALLASAFLFGLFHVLVQGSLFLERLLPSTFMGLVLGWICLRSGSVFPGMLLHVLHNGLFMILSTRTDSDESAGEIAESLHMPISWMVVAAVAVAAGLSLVVIGTKNERTRE